MDFHSLQLPLVRGLSHRQIEMVALSFLQVTAPSSLRAPVPTPLLEIFENKMDLWGLRVFIGKNIKGLAGFTDVTHEYIQISQATYRRLEKCDPSARFTVAHEIGHGLLHLDYKSAVFMERSRLRAFEDPEWQANSFAAALLMPLPSMFQLFRAQQMTCEQVMTTYQVSWSAATRRVTRLQKLFTARRGPYGDDPSFF